MVNLDRTKLCWDLMWAGPGLALQITCWITAFLVFRYVLPQYWIPPPLAALTVCWLVGAITSHCRLVRTIVAYASCMFIAGSDPAVSRCWHELRQCPDASGFLSKFRSLKDHIRMSFLQGLVECIALWSLIMTSVIWLVLRWVPPELTETEKVELGALIGTVVLAFVAHATLPDTLKSDVVKSVSFVWTLVIVLVIFGMLTLFGELSKLQSTVDAWSEKLLHVDEFPIHVLVAMLAAGLLFLYDVVALMEITREHSRARSILASREGRDQRTIEECEKSVKNIPPREELFEMCLLVDAPLLLSLVGVIVYWVLRKVQLGQTADGFLAGAIMMQFVIWALLFVLVKKRMARRSSQPTAREANGAAG